MSKSISKVEFEQEPPTANKQDTPAAQVPWEKSWRKDFRQCSFCFLCKNEPIQKEQLLKLSRNDREIWNHLSTTEKIVNKKPYKLELFNTLSIGNPSVWHFSQFSLEEAKEPFERKCDSEIQNQLQSILKSSKSTVQVRFYAYSSSHAPARSLVSEIVRRAFLIVPCHFPFSRSRIKESGVGREMWAWNLEPTFYSGKKDYERRR